MLSWLTLIRTYKQDNEVKKNFFVLYGKKMLVPKYAFFFTNPWRENSIALPNTCMSFTKLK